jgi:hypothetical protein
MKIYGDTNSGNCLKVKWVCDKLALPYTWVGIDTLKGETRTTQFLPLARRRLAAGLYEVCPRRRLSPRRLRLVAALDRRDRTIARPHTGTLEHDPCKVEIGCLVTNAKRLHPRRCPALLRAVGISAESRWDDVAILKCRLADRDRAALRVLRNALCCSFRLTSDQPTSLS